MGIDIRDILGKIKKIVTQLAFLQIIFYILSKIVFALMELPHQSKDSTYIPYLIANIVLISAAIAVKILRHKFIMVRSLIKLQAECFLLWVINFIMMVFSWALLSANDWNFVERILVMICEFLSLFMITLLTKEDFISKMEFITYQSVLGAEIVAVSLKTVRFIKQDTASPNKDIVLLNLTTQIALIIILMDAIQKSYRKWQKIQVEQNMVRFENEMVITNRAADTDISQKKQNNLRQEFTP